MGRWWFCVSGSVSGPLALSAQTMRGDPTHLSHLLPYQLLNLRPSPQVASQQSRAIAAAAQRSVVTAQARLHPCAIRFPCMEYREGTTVSLSSMSSWPLATLGGTRHGSASIPVARPSPYDAEYPRCRVRVTCFASGFPTWLLVSSTDVEYPAKSQAYPQPRAH